MKKLLKCKFKVKLSRMSLLPNRFPSIALYKNIFKKFEITTKSDNLNGFCCSYISKSSSILKKHLL